MAKVAGDLVHCTCQRFLKLYFEEAVSYITAELDIWERCITNNQTVSYLLPEDSPCQYTMITNNTGERGNVVFRSSMLQAGRLRVRFLMRSSPPPNLSNPYSCTMSLVSTQPLTEISTSSVPGGKGRPARKVDNLIGICEPNV
jgi:hypothetical protein